MTVNLKALAIKSEVKVAMRYKNFKAVAMRCINKGKPKDVTKDCVILQNIRHDKNIYVKADKTTNHYKAEPQDYLTLLQKNMTKAYKKTNKRIPDSITAVEKKIAESLKLEHRIEVSASRDTFITLKDHKPDFINNPTCRLINPTKSEIGIISKHILDSINKEIIKVTKANLWRSTSNVIEWFKAVPNKSQHAFITFNVCDFYPSISEQLLTKALDYASQFTHITQQDRQIITHAKKSLLYHQNTPWEKKNTSNLFDVTMGSYDGAETCELVGIYMLSLITPKFKGQVGLYRHDGLAVCNATAKKIEKTKQEVSEIFKSNGLKITIEANKKTVNFLDVTLDLPSGSYKPFMKPNNKVLYVHRQSNHPPALLRNIPDNINKRLTSISSSQKVFDDAFRRTKKRSTRAATNTSSRTTHSQSAKKTTKEKVIWYNPPWNANVKTNLGRKFLNIIDRCFPNGHPLHKIFNKHTLKLSYSCMPNMKSIISSHNKALLSDYHRSQTQTDEKECNCRKKDQCPLDEKCLTQNVIYQATVSTQSSSETYVGLATNFKERYRNHRASFRHQSKRNETELSKHIWALKDNNKPFDIKWRIIKQCRPYSNVNNKCNLCLYEKFIIICRKNLCSLNKRNELASSCPHRNRYLLKNIL